MTTDLQQPMISPADIKKTMKILSCFGVATAPLYQFTPYEFMRDYLPILLPLEVLIYQTDAILEAAQKGKIDYRGAEPWLERKDLYLNFAKELGVHSPLLDIEAEKITKYCELENQMMYHGIISHEMILQATTLRGIDIIMLHIVCHKISKKPHNETVWKAIRLLEEINDIEVDIIEYHDDVASDDYNVYRMFVRMYGADGKQHVENLLNERWEEYQQVVTSLPEDQQAVFEEVMRLYFEMEPSASIPEPILETLNRKV